MFFCIFLSDPFQLARFRAVPVPFQQALQQQVSVHLLLLASSCRLARVWQPRGAAWTGPQASPTGSSPARPAAAACPSAISLAPVAGQRRHIGRIYIYMQYMHNKYAKYELYAIYRQYI